jgi:hypothetical protein
MQFGTPESDTIPIRSPLWTRIEAGNVVSFAPAGIVLVRLCATGMNCDGFDVGRQIFSLAVPAEEPAEVVHEVILPVAGTR